VLTSIVVSIVRTCTRFATLTLLAGLLLAIGAGYYTAHHFAINTDINTLISDKLDWRQRDVQFDQAFDRDSTILAVVEAPTPELTNLAATALEQKLKGDTKNFLSMQALGSGEFFEKNGLLFLPTQELAQLAGQFESAAPLVEIMAGDPSIRGLTGALETGLAGVQRGEVKLDNTVRPFNLIAQTVEDILSKGSANFSWRELTSKTPLTASDRRAFIEFKPVIDYGALEPGKEATDAIRKAAAELDFPQKFQARVRLTGPIPIANEEYSTVQEGAIVNAIGTIVVVLFILWLALHSAKIIFAVFVNLFIGLSITTAVGLWMVGSLNLLSIAFAVLFIGLGVDFGIQFSVRYRSERFKNDNLAQALEEAARRSAVPLSLAAMATAAGFLCFLPTDYKGISELGEIAGAGMLIAFTSSITVLPALLRLLNPPGEKEPVGYAFLAPLDRFLEDHRIPIVVGTLALVIAGLPLLYFMRFDFNPMNLRSPNAESIATYLDLRKDPNTGASAIDVLTRSEADARKIEARLEKLEALAAPFGIGRGIHLGDTIIGTKGRVAFEAPAAEVLLTAHRELEKLVLTARQQRVKELVSQPYGDLVHEGQLLDPVCRDIEALLERSQERVCGEVHVLMRPGSVFIEGVSSPYSLMAASKGVYGEAAGEWTAADALGFSKIVSLTGMFHRRAGLDPAKSQARLPGKE